MTNNTKNRKKMNLAIEAAPAAIPPNPKIAATIATTKKIIVQRNISFHLVKHALSVKKLMPPKQQRFANRMLLESFSCCFDTTGPQHGKLIPQYFLIK
jgi:hypothetical protein